MANNLMLVKLLRELGNDYELVYKPNMGNAGDGVIAAGTYDFFSDNNIEFTQFSANKIYNNDYVLIYGGGGNLIEGLYDEGHRFLKDNISIFRKIIILPSTIRGFDSFFRDFKEKLIVFCREEYTYKYFTSIDYTPQVNVYIQDDMAFSLSVNKYLIEKLPKKKSINCYRTDDESVRKKKIKNNYDISRSWNGDFWHNEILAISSTAAMASFLQEYEMINTDRLHVAILGALMGANVSFHPNSYYKNMAVYEFSIKDQFPNVVFTKSTEKQSFGIGRLIKKFL